MNLPNLETVSIAYHERRVAALKAGGLVAQRNADGEELLVPWPDLSQRWRAETRDTVRAVYGAIEACTIEPVRTAEA